MDKVKILTKNLVQTQNKGRENLLSLTESPIEKIFLLYVLNFIENAAAHEFYSKIHINGYSFIDNSEPENQFSGDKAIGLEIISCGTGVKVYYPNGIPLSDGRFINIEKNYFRREKSLIYAEDNAHFSYIQSLLFYPQYQVQIGQTNYRLDFAFLLHESINHESTLVKKVGIECDGYDYHSSPKQFKRDRERGRQLQKNDWTIIRYSGSDINMRLYQNYKEEIEEIFDLMGFGISNR